MKPWARRHQRLLTLSTAGVLACVMALWGAAELTAPFPHSSGSSCDAAASTTTKRSAITISLYNAGAPPGSAAKLAKSLTGLGFKVGTVANAPVGITVADSEIVGTSATDPAAGLVAATFGSSLVISDPSLLIGPGVNVFIGPRLGPLVASAPAEVSVNDSSAC